MRTIDKFWDAENRIAANLCEDRDCRLFWDNLQEKYFVIKKLKDGSVDHSKATKVFEGAKIEDVLEFIKSYNGFKKTVEIIGGGTLSHVRSHFALAAPAYGKTARQLAKMCEDYSDKLEVNLQLTKMASAGEGHIETNEDVERLVDLWIQDPNVKIVFFNVAMADFTGKVVSPGPNIEDIIPSGKYAPRLKTHLQPGQNYVNYLVNLTPADKIISKIRKVRKDIFLVGFKMTNGATADEQYLAGLNLLKESSCNLVLANDTTTKLNMVITPEEARYHVTTDREEALKGLVEMTYLRSHLTFTRSTVVAGEAVPWDSPLVPPTLKAIVDYCIKRGAYKPFRNATVGHFAAKIGETTFLTSRRKTNFNDLDKLGLVKVMTDGPDNVIAYGFKPSVGGQSQRIVFAEHPEYDCILHFHCPIKVGSEVPTVSQREYECGSHQCGQNTSNGLKKFGNLSAVYLDNHGPNIVFNHSINPTEIAAFIEENFDLLGKTGGPVKLEKSMTGL